MKRRDVLRALAIAPWLSSMSAGLRAEASPGSIIAATFGAVPAARSIRRVYAAGAPASVLLAVLAPEKLIGWPFTVPAEARAWLPPAVRELPQVGRLAGRGSTASSEALLQLEPDLIFDIGTVDATYRSSMERVADQTGLPCALVHGRLAEHPAQLRELGRMFGVAERGERLAAWAEALFVLAERVREALPPAERPRVYFGRGSDGLQTGLEGSINMEVIDFAGGRNAAAAAGRGGLAKVSLEQILGWDPEVIVTQDPEFYRHARTDASWRPVAAVRSGRVHLAPSLPFGWLDVPPSVNRLIGVRWLIERLYPGSAGGAMELRAAVGDFYRLFYGVEPGTKALDALMGEAA